MWRFALRRMGLLFPMMVAVLTLTFFIITLAPGSPFGSERRLPPEIEQVLNTKYGFDQPRWKQYMKFMSRLAGFSFDPVQERYSWRPYPDFGDSSRYRDRRVNDIIKEALPVSSLLGLSAYMVALLAGIPLGVLSATREDSWIDHLTMIVSDLGACLPTFVLGPVLVIVFCLELYWLPPARVQWAIEWGYVRIPTIKSLVLPTCTLAALYVAYVARLTRSGMIEALGREYIRTARAKGLPEWRILFKHALRVGIIPVVSFTGPALSHLITGTFVVETIFSLPGLGRYFVDAINNRDYFLLLGITSFFTIALVICNLFVDLTYAYLDPRIRYNSAGATGVHAA